LFNRFFILRSQDLTSLPTIGVSTTSVSYALAVQHKKVSPVTTISAAPQTEAINTPSLTPSSALMDHLLDLSLNAEIYNLSDFNLWTGAGELIFSPSSLIYYLEIESLAPEVPTPPAEQDFVDNITPQISAILYQLPQLNTDPFVQLELELADFPQAFQFLVNYSLHYETQIASTLSNPQNIAPLVEGCKIVFSEQGLEVVPTSLAPSPGFNLGNHYVLPNNNPIQCLVELGTFSLQVKQALAQNDPVMLASLFTNQISPLPLQTKALILEQNSMPESLPLILETCSYLNNSDQVSTTVTQEVVEVFQDVVVNVTIKIVKVDNYQELLQTANLVIKFISSVDKDFIAIILNDYIAHAENKKLEAIKQQIKNVCKTIASHPAVVQVSRSGSPLARFLTRNIISSILIQVMLSQSGQLSSTEIRKIVLFIRTILSEQVFKELDLDEKSAAEEELNPSATQTTAELIKQLIALVKQGKVKEAQEKASSNLIAALYAIYTGLIDIHNQTSQKPTPAANQTKVAGLDKAEIYLAMERDYKDVAIAQAAEQVLAGIIRQQFEKQERCDLIIEVLKQDESVWNKLIDLIIYGQKDQIVDLVNALVEEARKIAHITAVPGTKLGIVQSVTDKNVFSKRTLSLALNNIKQQLISDKKEDTKPTFEELIAEAV